MPDPIQEPATWVTVLRAARDVFLAVGVAATAIGTQCNHEKIAVVQQNQAENGAKIDATAAKVDVAAAKAEEVKTTLKAETAKTAAKLGSIEAEVKKK